MLIIKAELLNLTQTIKKALYLSKLFKELGVTLIDRRCVSAAVAFTENHSQVVFAS